MRRTGAGEGSVHERWQPSMRLLPDGDATHQALTIHRGFFKDGLRSFQNKTPL